jgi:hypothetical protein
MPLTEAAVRDAKPGLTPRGTVTDKSYKITDGGGLYLLVTPSGGRWWRFNYRFAGRRKTLSLGVYPGVSLEIARERRDLYRQLLAEGQDPGEYQKTMKQAEREAHARQVEAARFALDSDGALSVRLGNRRVNLTPAETAELRAFLHATRAVPIKEERPCP